MFPNGEKKYRRMAVSGFSFLLPSIPHVHPPLFASPLYPVLFGPYEHLICCLGKISPLHLSPLVVGWKGKI